MGSSIFIITNYFYYNISTHSCSLFSSFTDERLRARDNLSSPQINFPPEDFSII